LNGSQSPDDEPLEPKLREGELAIVEVLKRREVTMTRAPTPTLR
jgi:hypothetical protein